MDTKQWIGLPDSKERLDMISDWVSVIGFITVHGHNENYVKKKSHHVHPFDGDCEVYVPCFIQQILRFFYWILILSWFYEMNALWFRMKLLTQNKMKVHKIMMNEYDLSCDLTNNITGKSVHMFYLYWVLSGNLTSDTAGIIVKLYAVLKTKGIKRSTNLSKQLIMVHRKKQWLGLLDCKERLDVISCWVSIIEFVMVRG